MLVEFSVPEKGQLVGALLSGSLGQSAEQARYRTLSGW